MERKLLPYYFVAFMGEIYFIIPIWLFFYLRVIDYQQLTILITIQAITSVLLEIPTGAFADIFGKRITLIISFLTYSLTLFAYTISSTFGFFIILEILKGFAKSMYSGSFEAMVYDTLKQDNQKEKFDNVISDFTSLAWLALFISSFMGGYLFNINVYLPYILTALVYMGITFILIFFTKEPKVDSEKYDISIKHYLKQNLRGFGELFPNLKISTISIFIIIISFSYQMTSEFLGISQAQDYGFKPEHIGILFGSAYVISALFSQFYKRLKLIFNEKILLAIYIVIALASLLLANRVGLFLGGTLILSRIAFSTLYLNSKSILINSVVSSKNRATALSTLNLIVLFPFSIIVVTSGTYINKTSPNQFAEAFGVAILVALLAVGAIYWLIKKSPSYSRGL